MKVYLVDIYLANNLGDDMFLDHLAKSFPNTVFVPFYPGNKYDDFFQQYKNIRKFRYNLFDKICTRLGTANKLQDYKAMAKKYDGVLFIGGGIFREESYWKSVFDYRSAITDAFKAQKKEAHLIGSNFGPFYSSEFKDLHHDLFSKFTSASFRDLKSYSLFSSIPHVSYAPDVLWDFNLPAVKTDNKTVGISIIDPNHKSGLENYLERYVTAHKNVVLEYLKNGYKVKLFSFCETEGDLKVANEIASVASEQIEVCNYDRNIQKFLVEFGSCSEIIAARFHAVTIAMKFKIPVLPVIYGDKTRNLLEDLNFRNAIIEFDNLQDIKMIDTQNYIKPELTTFIERANQHFNFI